MTQIRLYTSQRDLGTVRLADGVGVTDLLEAMRMHQLFISEEQEPMQSPPKKDPPAAPTKKEKAKT